MRQIVAGGVLEGTFMKGADTCLLPVRGRRRGGFFVFSYSLLPRNTRFKDQLKGNKEQRVRYVDLYDTLPTKKHFS
jgi:hypothetical protein